jgi:hypothetical protein
MPAITPTPSWPRRTSQRHLGILHVEAMLSRTKQDNVTPYAMSDPGVFELCDQRAPACASSCRSSSRPSGRAGSEKPCPQP